MLITLAGLILGLWFLGVVTGYMLSGCIHLLLVMALLLVLTRFVKGPDQMY